MKIESSIKYKKENIVDNQINILIGESTILLLLYIERKKLGRFISRIRLPTWT